MHITENKKIILDKPRRGFSLSVFLFIIVALLSAWLMLALGSFHPADPSWSQTAWHDTVHNLSGRLGACIADVLFFAFGVLAYTIPPGALVLCYFVFHPFASNQHAVDHIALALRLIGLLGLLFTSCTLAALHVDDLYYFASGGVTGSLMSNAMLPWLQDISLTLVMLCLWAVSVTLFTGKSWLFIAEKIGALVLRSTTFISTGFRYQNKKVNEVFHEENLAELIKNSADPLINNAPLDKTRFEEAPFAAPSSATTAPGERENNPTTEEIAALAPLPSIAPSIATTTTTVEQRAVPATPDFAMDSLIHPFLMHHQQPLKKSATLLPTLELLAAPSAEAKPADRFVLEQTARLVETRLADYRIQAKVVGISPGPVITRFELDLAPGVKASRISGLSRDLARSLSAVAVRIVEVIPGKPYVGLELPNRHRQTVYLREVLDCASFRDAASPLTIVLGKDIAGLPVVADLAKMPHLLVAGTTGSGKSVGVNAMILSMLYKATPEEVRFIMIDPKMLELSVYAGIPHLLTDVVTDMKDAANALRWCVAEMERRYKLMSALGVRNLVGYNERIAQAQEMGRPIPDPFWKGGTSTDITIPVLEKLPYIVLMVDEFADLIMTAGKKIEELIARLAQKARAAGIHLILATQRPSVDVITGLIKANIPTRIAFTVSSKIVMVYCYRTLLKSCRMQIGGVNNEQQTSKI